MRNRVPPIAKSANPRRVLMLGATGTAGRATLNALVEAGHHVVALVRAEAEVRGLHPGAVLRFGRATDAALLRDTMSGESFDTLVSCLAARSVAPDDAWAVDYKANALALAAAQVAGVRHMVFLSSISVQKPRLASQKAKRAFEEDLIASGLRWTIVRPTVYFKSLVGQIARVRAGKPYLMFGDGTLTACKPISGRDLGRFVAASLDDPARRNAILPIGGPGPAITPREQGEKLFELLGKTPKFRQLPVPVFDVMATGARLLGKFRPAMAEKSELAEVARYYATESMLVWDAQAGRYDADATPETGRDRLFDHYARVIAGKEKATPARHALF